MDSLPQHIAIIMDGNGRWAKKRNLPRIMGHRAGLRAVQTVIEVAARRGIKALTLYTFSTENWKRPRMEIDALMSLLEKAIKENLKKLLENNVRFNVIGIRDNLSPVLRDLIKGAEEKTSSNSGMILTLALSYGSRQEIVNAIKKLYLKVEEGTLDISNLKEEDFEEFLYTKNLPRLDLIIRTSGEMRLSNFLLWQAAYSEIYVTDTLWPDFEEKEMEKALAEYEKRNRRFGE
ncbi:MAG: isoprenyl transferase [Candidatus Omnitrophota bacterium]